jgi:hypothetical protein
MKHNFLIQLIIQLWAKIGFIAILKYKLFEF